MTILRKLIFLTVVWVVLISFFSAPPSDAHYIGLSVEKIFAPGEKPEIKVSLSSKTEVEFRVYQIKDPVSYFANLQDPHYLQVDLKRKATDLPRMLRFLKSSFKEQLTESLQFHLTPQFRHNLREALGLDKGAISGEALAPTRSEIQEKSRVRFDLYPVLDKYPLIRRWSRTFDESETVIPLDLVEKGVYLVEAVHNDQIAHTVVILSDLAFITKRSPDSILTYTVRRTTGKPVPHVKFVVYKDSNFMTEGTTGKDGVVTLGLSEEVAANEGLTKIMAFKDGDFTISANWYYAYYGREGLKSKAYIYTERPVYRPGQTVHFKAILREIVKDTYQLPDRTKTYSVVVKDPKGAEIYNQNHAINAYGSLFGELPLKEDAPLGEYLISVTLNGIAHEGRFKIEEYKKPEFEVKVTTSSPGPSPSQGGEASSPPPVGKGTGEPGPSSQKHYTRGDTISVEVDANYYFGSPVTNATVYYDVFRTRYYRPWWYGTKYAWYFESDQESGEEFYGYPRDSQLIISETGELDAEGKFRFEIETGSAPEEADYIYNIKVTVTDVSRRAISGSASVIVSRSNLDLTLSTPSWVYKPGDTVEVTAQVRDFDGNPAQGVPVHFEFKENIWGGSQVEDRATVMEATTGPEGSVTASYQPKNNGYLRVTATATDSSGHQTQTTRGVYVYKKGFYDDEAAPESQAITIAPDKDSYRVGDTARLFIASPVKDATILLTLEGTSLYTYQILELKGSSALAEVKITERYQPNVYVSVASVFEDRFYEKKANLMVIPEEKFLNVEITSDKEIYRPQEEAEFTVKTTDFRGNPLSAEVSIGIVDASIYAISPELAPDIKKFFYNKRYQMVQTLFSDPHFYIYSESKSGKLAALRQGKKTTALADFKEEYVQPEIRKDFKDTIFWLPTLVTDAGGSAKVKVRYPDNLTRWRATARAVTPETLVGSVTQNTITRKDLIVRMEVPRFFRQKDQVTITTIAHNYLSEDKKVKFTLEVQGLEFVGSKEPVEKVVPKNGEARVDWVVRAVEMGTAVLTAQALTNEESDGLQLKVPVLPHGIDTVVVHNKDLRQENETYTHRFIKPEGAIPNSSELKLTFSPSLSASMVAALPYLLGYPYG